MNKQNKKDQFNLKGKTALITGAGGLLGFEHAYALLEKEAKVILTDVNSESLSKVSERLNIVFKKAQIAEKYLDVSNIKSVINVSENLKDRNTHIDILINNAAINPKVEGDSLLESSRLENFSSKQWDIELAVGLTGAFNCCKVFGTDMYKNHKKGVIVNIASDLSVIAPNQEIYKNNFVEAELSQPVKPITYSVIKHGLIGLTKYLATYWPNSSIRCNALSPGGVFNDQNNEFLKKVENLIPLGRLAKKEEYRGAIQFLCSDASSYMNGHNLIIDGGRTIW